MGGERRGDRISGSWRRRTAAGLAAAGLAWLGSAAAAQTPASEVERECREWADAFFSEATERRDQEIARCIAERDPTSPQARAIQEKAARDAQARTSVARRQQQEAIAKLAREEEETRRRCGGELVEALAPLYFCDTPEVVARKAAAVDDLDCAGRGSCDRLRLRIGNAQLWVYPKYSDRGLWHLALYAEERTAADYQTALRDDWQRVVTAMEAQFGPAVAGGSAYPDFFAVDGVEVIETHRWQLGRRDIRIGVFTADSTYAARLTVEDTDQIASDARRKP